jgi:hypothetical protein
MGPVSRAELLADLPHVMGDGTRCYQQNRADLVVREPLGYQGEHSSLSPREHLTESCTVLTHEHWRRKKRLGQMGFLPLPKG